MRPLQLRYFRRLDLTENSVALKLGGGRRPTPAGQPKAALPTQSRLALPEEIKPVEWRKPRVPVVRWNVHSSETQGEKPQRNFTVQFVFSISCLRIPAVSP